MGTDEWVVRFMEGTSGVAEEERELFRKILEIYNNPSAERWFWIWGIYHGDRLCGHMELKDSEHTSASELEMVYMMHPAERGKGYISEVLSFFKEAQQEWKRTIIATVQPDNEISIHLLKRWGITKETTLLDDDGASYIKFWLQTADK